jgi:hypothetical protein
MRHDGDKSLFMKIVVVAVALIFFIIIMTSIRGNGNGDKYGNGNKHGNTKITNKKNKGIGLLSLNKLGDAYQNIYQMYTLPPVGTPVGTGVENVIVILADDANIANGVQTINCDSTQYGNGVFHMATSNINNSVQETVLAPVGIFSFPNACSASYLAYGPYNVGSNIPMKLSGSKNATGSTGTNYRLDGGDWDPTQLWLSSIQPNPNNNYTPWALVSNTGQTDTVTKIEGTCAGETSSAFLHSDTDIIMSCLPIGLMSLESCPTNSLIPTPIIVGLGVLGGLNTCPLTASPNDATAIQPIIYLWYWGGEMVGLAPCSTTINTGPQETITAGGVTFPTVTCSTGLITQNAIPGPNGSFGTSICPGGLNTVFNGVDHCLSGDNYTYADLCMSGYGTCGYPIPIPNPSSSFVTLGMKIIQNYVYVWGYNQGTIDGINWSYICRCNITYDTANAGLNTSVEIDPTFGGNSTGWYSIEGSIDFLDVVNFGYGPLVIWSATTTIIDRMAQLSTVTIQIVDHSTYTTSNNTINTIPISLFTRSPYIQTKIISYKETLKNTWIPMLTGCLCTTTPRGIWLIGDVLQPRYGIDPRFTAIDQSGQQYFELFISDQLLFCGPPGDGNPQFSPNLNSTAAASGCWIATLEHLPAGINPVCADGVNFVSAYPNNLTPRPVFPNYNYQSVPYYGLNMTLMNTGPMSPYTIAGTRTGYGVSTTTYLGIMGVGNPSGINAPGGGMRVPHWLQLDAVPERPDSVNTCDDFPYIPWQVRHYLYTVTSLYIDPAGVVTNEPVDIKYTPTTNLWDLSCGLSVTASLDYTTVNITTTDQKWPMGHWFFQHILAPGSPQVVKSVSLSCTLTDLGSVTGYSDTYVNNYWYTNYPDYPQNYYPSSVTYYMQMSFTDLAGRNYINTQEYNLPDGMAGDIMNKQYGAGPEIVQYNLSTLAALTNYTQVAYNTYDCQRFDGALAQIILGTYTGAFLATWESTSSYWGPAVTNLPTDIHGLQYVDGNQYTPAWSGVGAIGTTVPCGTVCRQTFFMPDSFIDNVTTINSSGLISIMPGMGPIKSLDCVTFNGCTYDQWGNPYFNNNMVMFYTAADLTTKFVIGGCYYTDPTVNSAMTTTYTDFSIKPVIYL